MNLRDCAIRKNIVLAIYATILVEVFVAHM